MTDNFIIVTTNLKFLVTLHGENTTQHATFVKKQKQKRRGNEPFKENGSVFASFHCSPFSLFSIETPFISLCLICGLDVLIFENGHSAKCSSSG